MAGNTLATSSAKNRFLLQGREYIAELGIYDYRNRMYLPELGRFLETDPKGFDAGDMNLFRYCGDDPVDGSDPMGLSDLNLIPTWDERRDMADNHLSGREYYRMMNGETKDKMVVISAHGARGYVMNTTVTKPAYVASLTGVPVPRPMRVDIGKLVTAIQNLDNYTPTKPIRLDICFAGWGGAAAVAQKVANGLITNEVTANTDIVKADSGTGNGEWRNFNSPQSNRPTNVVNKSVRSYQSKDTRSDLGGIVPRRTHRPHPARDTLTKSTNHPVSRA